MVGEGVGAQTQAVAPVKVALGHDKQLDPEPAEAMNEPLAQREHAEPPTEPIHDPGGQA